MIDRIKQDQLDARKRYLKSKNYEDDLETKLLTTLIGEAQMPGKNKDIFKLIRKYIKNANEVLKLGDEYQIARANSEIKILNSYLPTQLTEDELTNIILDIDSKNIGYVMKELNKKHKGEFDGRLAIDIIKVL